MLSETDADEDEWMTPDDNDDYYAPAPNRRGH